MKHQWAVVAAGDITEHLMVDDTWEEGGGEEAVIRASSGDTGASTDVGGGDGGWALTTGPTASAEDSAGGQAQLDKLLARWVDWVEAARCPLTRHREGLALRAQLPIIQGAHMRVEVTTGQDLTACRLKPRDVGEQIIISSVPRLLLEGDVHIAQDQVPCANGNLQPDDVGGQLSDPKL